MIKPFYFINPRSKFEFGFTPEVTTILTNMMLFYGGACKAPQAKIIASAARITREGYGDERFFA